MPGLSYFLCLLSAFLLVTSGYLSRGGKVVNGHAIRGIMVDRKVPSEGERELGTRSALMRGHMTLYVAGSNPQLYTKHSVYIPCKQHLTSNRLHDLTSVAVKGMLVELCGEDTNNEEVLGLYLATRSVKFPIYFMEEGADTALLHHTLTSLNREMQTVAVSIGKSQKTTSPIANTSVEVMRITGQLQVKPKEMRRIENNGSGVVPRVLLTAHFDTFGVAPASQSSGGASGAVAVTELWRRATLMASQVKEDSSISPYSVSLLLGSTARFNYASTNAWLAERRGVEVSRFNLIICVDELLPPYNEESEEDVLYMHVQDLFLKGAEGEMIVERAKRVAQEKNIVLKVVPNKINFHSHDLRFEHEVFANRQLPAVSFSSHRAHNNDQIFRGVRQPVTAQVFSVLTKRVDFIYAFMHTALGVAPQASWPGSDAYLQGMLAYSAGVRRSPIAHDGKDLLSFAKRLEGQLHNHNSAVRSDFASATVALEVYRMRVPGITVYSPYMEDVHVYVGNSLSMDLSLFLAVVLAVGLWGVTEFGLRGVWRLVAS